jgi:hypothetical protein
MFLISSTTGKEVFGGGYTCIFEKTGLRNIISKYQTIDTKPGVVVHACNPSTQEEEARRMMNLR